MENKLEKLNKKHDTIFFFAGLTSDLTRYGAIYLVIISLMSFGISLGLSVFLCFVLNAVLWYNKYSIKHYELLLDRYNKSREQFIKDLS